MEMVELLALVGAPGVSSSTGLAGSHSSGVIGDDDFDAYMINQTLVDKSYI